MIFMLTYQIDRDKQVECQTFFTQMTDEQIAVNTLKELSKLVVGTICLTVMVF